MKMKRLVLATAVLSSLGGLYGCSEGDDSSVVIEAGDGGTTTDTGSSGSLSQNCPDWTTARNTVDDVDVCQLPSEILEDRSLSSEIIWLMSGRVTVGNGNQEMSVNEGTLANSEAVLDVTLSIEPGTQVIARTGTFANLLITRGSKIQATGTASEPIIFSSDDEGYDGAGEWGGIILHGYGLHNECLTANNGVTACNVDSEGESGFGGGYTADDSSGRMSYVIVTEGGYEFAVGNEINGISLIGVGSGTIMDHIQVNSNADDGIEFYGGNVNVKYMVLTGNQDDSIDWDEGYQGNIQYVIVKQTEDVGGNAIEADTQGTDDFLSRPTIANATFIGHGDEEELFVFKSGSAGFLHNSVATVDSANTTITDCVLVDGADAQDDRNISLVLNNIIADCTNLGDAVLSTTTIFSVAAGLDANYASTATEATLGAAIDWDVINATYPNSGPDHQGTGSVADGDFLDETDYAGAVEPGETAPWFQGWILDGTL